MMTDQELFSLLGSDGFRFLLYLFLAYEVYSCTCIVKLFLAIRKNVMLPDWITRLGRSAPISLITVAFACLRSAVGKDAAAIFVVAFASTYIILSWKYFVDIGMLLKARNFITQRLEQQEDKHDVP